MRLYWAPDTTRESIPHTCELCCNGQLQADFLIFYINGQKNEVLNMRDADTRSAERQNLEKNKAKNIKKIGS